MSRHAGIFLAASLALAGASIHIAGQQTAQGTTPPRLPADMPVLPYHQVDWPAPAHGLTDFPDGPWTFKDVPSLAVTRDGNILVLRRTPHPVVEFDQTGKFVRSFGDGMFSEGRVRPIPRAEWVDGQSHYNVAVGAGGCAGCGAHSVRVDPDGNLWLIDATGHVVYKTTREGKELMRLGTKGVSGTDRSTFNLPTDIGFAPNGDLYVSDGYGSARVVKFSHDGSYLKEWGVRGKGPGQFALPHNLVVDAGGKVYVNDRDNQRVEVFDADGAFLTEWSTQGQATVSAFNITKDQKIWTGGVQRTTDGKAVGTLPDVPFHGMTVTDSGDVYFSKSGGVVMKYTSR